jgi:23S rRNA (adenine1618-N6)-methyltransferase
MICPGGDVGFVSRILAESLVLKTRVQWYTAMFGKLSSLQQIVAKLKEHDITNFAVTCLQAGYKTKRWAVGWSFHDLRPRNEVARHGELVHAVCPLPTEQTILCPLMSAKWAGEKVDRTIKTLDVRWMWRQKQGVGVMVARENVWSRAARRKRHFQATKDGEHGADVEMVDGNGDANVTADESEDEDEEEPIALAVKIRCLHEQVDVRWLRGVDNMVFVSFCWMLKRSLTSRE